MTQGYDGSIRIDTKIDEAGFNKSTSGISAGLGGLKSALLGVAATIAATFSVAVLARFSSKILNIAADFQRLQLAARIVGGMFGYTDAQVKQLTGDLVASGIQTDIANKAFINFAREGLDASFLPALARGAQDLAVFADSGETSSDMFDRLMTGILTFNPLILRAAKVMVNLEEANKKWVAANGGVVENMTIQQKQQAAMIAVTEELTKVSGLYEMGQKTAAGQMQSNIRIMNEFYAALGAPFQGALYTVVKGFNDLVKVLTLSAQPGGRLHNILSSLASIAMWLAEAIVNLFNSIGSLFGVSAKVTGTFNDNATQAGASLGGAADAAGDLADNTTAAGKAAKDALAAFDQLNVLQRDTGTGGGGGTPGGGGGPIPLPGAGTFDDLIDVIKGKMPTGQDILDWIFATPLKWSETFSAWVDKIDWGVLSGDIADAISDLPWSKYGSQFGKFFNNMGTAIGKFYSEVKWGELGNSIATGFADFVVGAITMDKNATFKTRVTDVFAADLKLMQDMVDEYGWVLVIGEGWSLFLDAVQKRGPFDIWWDETFIPGLKTGWTNLMTDLGTALDTSKGLWIIALSPFTTFWNETFIPTLKTNWTLLMTDIFGSKDENGKVINSGLLADIKKAWDTFWGDRKTDWDTFWTVTLPGAWTNLGTLLGTMLNGIGLVWQTGINILIGIMNAFGAYIPGWVTIPEIKFFVDETQLKTGKISADGLTASVNGIPNEKTTKIGWSGKGGFDTDADGIKGKVDAIPNEKTPKISWSGKEGKEGFFDHDTENIKSQILSIPNEKKVKASWDGKDGFNTDADGLKGKVNAIPGEKTPKISWSGKSGFDEITTGIKGSINSITDKTVKISIDFIEGTGGGGTTIWKPTAAGGLIPSGGWAMVGDALSGRRTGFEELVHALPGGGFQVFPNSSLGGLGMPRMATGGVVPPSASFGAFSGGRASGAMSADSIRQIVREETRGMGDSQEVVIRFEGNLAALVRELKPYTDRENARIGSSLVRGLA